MRHYITYVSNGAQRVKALMNDGAALMEKIRERQIVEGEEVIQGLRLKLQRTDEALLQGTTMEGAPMNEETTAEYVRKLEAALRREQEKNRELQDINEDLQTRLQNNNVRFTGVAQLMVSTLL